MRQAKERKQKHCTHSRLACVVRFGNDAFINSTITMYLSATDTPLILHVIRGVSIFWPVYRSRVAQVAAPSSWLESRVAPGSSIEFCRNDRGVASTAASSS